MNPALIRSPLFRTLCGVFLVAFVITFAAGCGGSEPEPEAQAVEREELNDQLQNLEQQGE
ncbi:MAG: hypothetical protein ACF8TS_18225 [Maioricimonas sp. JB049]